MKERQSKYDYVVKMLGHIDEADMTETCKCVLFDEQLTGLIEFQETLPDELKMNCDKLQSYYERVYNFKSNHSHDPYKSLKGIYY